MLLAVIRGC